MMQQLVNRTWVLADLMLKAAKRPLHVTVMVADKGKQVKAVQSAWAGGMPVNPSRGSFFGPAKAKELYDSINPESDHELTLTPVAGYPYSPGYKGGVRTKKMEDFYITAASGWSQEADLLMALTLNFAMSFEVRLHHIGFRHGSEHEMLIAISQDEHRYATRAMSVPAPDHTRYYLRVESSEVPNGVFWVEHQFYPDEPPKRGIHFDFACQAYLLGFLQRDGLKYETWEPPKNGPMGMVSVVDRDGVELAIMQRSTWTQVESW